jgi:hypothetical protein
VNANKHLDKPDAVKLAISVPAGFAGSNQWVQVVNSEMREHKFTNGVWYVKNAIDVLDTFYPYVPNSLTVSDSPGEGTDPTDQAISVSDSFTMWLMFKPTNGQWVPLKKTDWGWGGSGILSGTNWILINSNNIPNPPCVNTSLHPQWTNNLINITNYYEQK